MKHVTLQLQRLFLFVTALMSQVLLFAQNDTSLSVTTKTTKTTTTTTNDFLASPWMWALGAAVFILLLVALLKNRNRA